MAPAPAISGATVGLGEVTLNWAASDPGIEGESILDYEVNVFTSIDATTPVKTVNTDGPGDLDHDRWSDR